MTPAASIPLPAGKRFAFTVVDDTDQSTVENVGPVYRLLAELGIRTTKTLWTLDPTEESPYAGSQTASDRSYRDFLQGLAADGFELASHGATMHSSTRERTLEGLERFAEWFGEPPRMHVNHFKNRDNLYWGRARLSSPLHRAVYRVASREPRSLGHVEETRFFWGDLSLEHIDFVRSFTYRETNLLRLGLPLAYRDPDRPFARRMFISTEGGDRDTFVAALAEEEQDRLVAEGGVCIMYTHFGAGFVQDGQVDPRFETLMRRLAGLGGWFVPASELLDAICKSDTTELTGVLRRELERRWLMERLKYGSS